MAVRPYKQEEDFIDTLVAEKHRNGFYGSSEFLDTRWSGGSTTYMGDHELEEGEACDDPDSSCDPETAFSYIDEKLSMVLGDVQKFFQGGVSAEKLGSKFGGYGSFLPTQERTPSILHQEKPASVIANDAYCRTKKPSSEGIVEKIRRTAASSSAMASNSKAGSSSANVLHENGGRDRGPANERLCYVESSLPAMKVGENVGQPKKVTLRFRVGSDTNEKIKKSTIYSDFGLSNSSSATDDEADVDDKQGTDSDLDSNSDRSALTMIRVMTSNHVPDGMLLSPLPDLMAEPFLQKERLWSTNRDNYSEKARSPCVSKGDARHNLSLIKDQGDQLEMSKEKVRESASGRKIDGDTIFEHTRKKAKYEKGTEGGSQESSKHVDASRPPSKAFGKEFSKLNEAAGVERQARDAIGELRTGLRSMDSHGEPKGLSVDKVTSEYPMYEPDRVPRDSCSPFEPVKEVDQGRSSLSRPYNAEKATGSSSHDSINGQFDTFPALETRTYRRLDAYGEPGDVKKRSTAKELVVTPEIRAYTNQGATKKSTSKIDGGAVAASDGLSTMSMELPRELSESRKNSKELVKEMESSRRSTKDKGKESSKEPRNSFGKDKHGKAVLSRDSPAVHIALREATQQSLKTRIDKDLQVDPFKVHKVDSMELHKKEKPSKERIKSEYSSKEVSRLAERDRQRESASRDAYVKPPLQTASVPEATTSDKLTEPTEALPPQPPGNAAVAPPYVVITERWVACDVCEKWRLLPPGVVEDDLPGKWRCKMLDWLAGKNNCDISEEDTTHATRLLFNAAAPPAPQDVPPMSEVIQPALPPPPPNPSLPPAPPIVTSVLPTNVNPSQELMVPDKSKAISSRKRKMPPATSTEAGQSKSKGVTDPGQGSHEREHPNKLGSGDASTSHQEKTQAKLGGVDAGHVQGGGKEKRKVKEREKAKRFRPSDGASPLGKEHSQTPGNQALKEAVRMKHSADRLQGKVGMEREGTGLYLQAALKFLQAASMLEGENLEHGDNRHVDGTQSLQIYADTAKLCEYCARNYEHSKDLASATLAYKCVGLARMRVVQAKSLSIGKDRAELQSAHHQTAPCESPSSSTALDVDSISNVAADRVAARGAISPALKPQIGGSFIIAAKSRPSFNRILQYVADTSAAMDALSKSHSSFKVANSTAVNSPECMTALKRVLEFGFHDVETLVRLVRVALEVIEQQRM